jgi:hypothetical protein
MDTRRPGVSRQARAHGDLRRAVVGGIALPPAFQGKVDGLPRGGAARVDRPEPDALCAPAVPRPSTRRPGDARFGDERRAIQSTAEWVGEPPLSAARPQCQRLVIVLGHVDGLGSSREYRGVAAGIDAYQAQGFSSGAPRSRVERSGTGPSLGRAGRRSKAYPRGQARRDLGRAPRGMTSGAPRFGGRA